MKTKSLLLITVCMCICLYGCETEEVVTYPIVSLHLGSTMHGNFCLGTGTVDDVLYYYTFRKHPDGGLSLEMIPARWRTTIYEGDHDPCVVRRINNFHGRSVNCIYVPTGTVIQEYSVSGGGF